MAVRNGSEEASGIASKRKQDSFSKTRVKVWMIDEDRNVLYFDLRKNKI